jgi:hypothetical protein
MNFFWGEYPVNRVRRILGGVVVAAAVCLLPAAGADEKPAANPLDGLGFFIGGAWVGQGKGPTPDFRTRVVYEWGLNKKVLKIRSFLSDGKGERQVYESFCTYHPDKKKIVFLSVAADGHIFDGTLERKGDAVEYEFVSFFGDKKTAYRQTTRIVDNDNVVWTVLGKKGDEWVTVIEAKQQRVRDAK